MFKAMEHLQQSIAAHEKACELAKETGNEPQRAVALTSLAGLMHGTGEFERGRSYMKEAIAVTRSLIAKAGPSPPAELQQRLATQLNNHGCSFGGVFIGDKVPKPGSDLKKRAAMWGG